MFIRRPFCILVWAILCIAQGCSGLPRLDAVPPTLQREAVVAGFTNIRYRPDQDPEQMIAEGVESFAREKADLARKGHEGPLPTLEFLAISGGGDNGSFSAGLLNGWTEAGTRPEFKLVTGVSTGALIAPFAFLGTDYDAELKEIYRNISADDVLDPRNPLAALTNDAMADTQPLKELLSKYVTQDMLDAIADAYTRGRQLWIATTDLDARQAVIWNLTRIAASRNPEAINLFRSLMVASASIPGAFPPLMIDVVVGDEQYQEMHVDGGVMSQVIMYPPSLNMRQVERRQVAEPRDRRIYIIRNARLDPQWAEVDRQTMDIAGRSISSLIQSQGIGDLYRIFLTAQRDEVEYNLAYIPPSFKAPHRENFDTIYMGKLFTVGYELAKEGYPWEKFPPFYNPPDTN